MTEAKPSGIRPPSKIGRPCCTLPPRPAIPPSSPKASGNSMDHLWETHGRKLSEAGLRRGSDTSVVLTEDTDSFIIGDRVWVGGTKPGSIAYIGETQFAPGDWAGVVLDEPIGKNDGSVAGCRYFQCEPKRGIFSRLTRLTRQPLPEASSSPILRTPTTPPDSTRGCLIKSVSPSLNASTTSLSSTVSQRDLKIGERVIVSSSQGSKTGVLRYMGITEFASGEWCGIELDEPLGKNDGSVNDKRYFECRPKYGLFAPMHKVSKSPLNKRTSCVVHRPSGAALNSTLKRTNSRESLVSISSVNSSIAGSRIATGATREMLKEKQQEIEFLRRERDLERDRVTKAANQADQAEQSVILIKQEYDKYREEMEKTVLNVEMALNKILEEKNALAIQLEEERRKCEDLLFRFEEESVNKDDIQKERSDQSVINTVNENRIKELEKLLSEERERVIQLERDSTKLFEAEEELARLRSCQTSNQDKTEFEDLRNRNENLKETKDALEKQVNEKTVLVEEYLESMKNLEIKLKEKEEEGNLKKQVENDLQNNLKETKENLREKLMYIENLRQVFETNTNALKKELTEMKKRIEDVNEKHATEKQSLIVEYEKIVEDKNKQIEMKSQQLTSESQKYLESQSNVLENLKAENMKHINELSESFGKQLNVKDSKLKEISSQLNEKISEAQKLSNELSNQQDLYNRKDKELNDILHKLEELNVQLKAAESKNVSLADQLRIQEHAAEDTNRIMKEKEKLEEDLSMLRATATDSSAHLEKLNEELKLKDKELAELRASMTTQIEELKKEFQGEIDVKSKYIEEINLDASQKTMILNKKEKEISELKSLVESKDEEIKHLVEKNSELQYALTLSEQTKTNLESELRVFESNIENLNQQLARAEEKFVNVSSQKDKLELDIANLISSSANSSEQLTKYNDELREKERDIDKLQDKLYQMEKDLTSTQGKLENTEKELNKNVSLLQESRLETENVKSQLIKEKELCLELSEKIKKHESKENDLLNEIEIAKSTELSLKEKCNLISDLNDKLKKIEEDKVILRKEYEIAEESFKKESLDLQKQLDDAKTQLIASKEEIQALQKAKVKLEANQSASRWSIEELTDKLNSETKARTKLDSIIAEKDSKIKSLDDALSDLRREKEMINLNREMINQETVNTLSSMENTIADLNEKLVVATGNIETKSNELAIAQAEAEQRKTQISELTVESDSLKNSLIQINDKLHSLEDKLKEKDNELRKTEEDKTRLENNLKQVEIELKNVQSDIVTKNNILAELNDKIKDVQDTKEDFIIKLQNKLESDIKAKESALEISEKQRNELVQVKESLEQLLATKSADLNANEITMNNLKEQLKVLQDKQEHTVAKEDSKKEEVKAMMNEIEEMRKENTNLLITKDTLEKLIMEQGSQIDILTNTIKSKEKEAEKNTQNLIEKLNIVTTEAAQLKEVHSRLEKENKQIASKLSEATNQLKLSRESIKNNFDAAGGDVNQQMDKDIEAIRLKEENEIVKGQIDFLNSVIVDMQRKNETLLCKIEVLEMGVPANEADDYNRTTLDKRNKAPRMFCDICDQFDLHETEDCPRQAQDFTEPEKIIKSPKKSSLERPYCENCETFGHDTRDCDDTETY
ncbi:CAP-Gly domain-containing linker protein 1 isoform X1 [Polistes fuscatus]|uniref:CAP-Gly domain-containing linker protein 1 isoform X1 n=2 Tax=Polistes fuscatus TaxID=30207 RepID=UPI001CA93BF0|nr:CAP-Gly domain-containing linker protein 1 isoform X1 [Polistes fuscatus]